MGSRSFIYPEEGCAAKEIEALVINPTITPITSGCLLDPRDTLI